ncbi:MAG: M28 family peptidase [Candidatus Aminicenantes bacterium]|nr:M28 family peptidase [Candidatus Aminicenantes bacterium]NIM83798.1 M28 family peptidase [Candidatus Aminicenantes bacterium]NIN21845.1 M28 family peptidase [Candidatus Aminicenantes bacterium]NIN46952.1 M28 family peptidase [Candidatus Aminicenantes bacterium]NIN89874.1 M28 family peptidase [Candidatus Aminicenantes bacterium]
MKGKRSIFLVKFVFLLIIFSSFFTGQMLVSGDKTGPPVLARVEVTGMLNDLGLPVYAHLQDGTGQDYALVIAPQTQLDRAGARYRILDKDARKADYFIISMFPANKRVPADQLDNVLLDDGVQVIIRSTFKKVKALVESDFNVQRLDDTPMVLAAAPHQLEISPLAVEYNAAIAQLINQVTQTTVETYVRNLSGENPVNIGGSSYTITTRHTTSGTPIEKATQYVYEFMQGLGLTVSYHNWSELGYSGRNVIGEKTGTIQPDEILLITAHLDDLPSGGIAPGADDNASGSVGVMVSAEMLSQQSFNRTVRFVVFTGEEQWLLGSSAYADLVYQAGDNIVAVYNMDMISYDGIGEPYLRLHTRITSNPGYPGDLAIANTFIDVVNTYSLDNELSPIIDADGITQSDHSPFWSNGYSAILGIEDDQNDISPYYHSTADTVSTLNLTYFTNFVKAAVGTAAHLAVIDDGTLIAEFTASPTSGAVPLTVNFTDLSVGATSWSWNFGDTGTSTDKDPTHTYTSTGTYTVTLTVTNASGSDTETKTDYITVTAPQAPVADFIASATNISVGDSVTFTDQSLNNPTSWDWTFAGGTPGSSTAQNPTVTYNTAGTFTVTLTAANAQGSDTETKTDYINVSAVPYCTSSGNSQSYEYIAGAAVGDLNNSSGASPYSDFTYLAAHLTQDDTVNVSLTPGFPGSSYTEYWRIWIDYNGDHDFEDTGEQVFSGSGSSIVTGSFTVPTSTITGDTRMRVSMSYSTYPPMCGTFTYGEVEDYTANISAACTQYTLTTNTVGNGNITLNPTGGTYCEGTVVTLTAVPDTGWQFDNWSGDLSGSTNPTTITMNADKNVTANFSEIGNCTDTVGYTTVFGSTSTSPNRRAMPFTMPENGEICGVTIYHEGGSGGLILGVYDGEGTPQNRLGVTPITTINSGAGWQTIELTSPAYVASGSTVWLAWVFQSNPGIRYQTGSPGRFQSSQTWSGGMPDPFGSGSQTSYIYSIYANFTPSAPPQYTLTVNTVGQGTVSLNPPGGVYDAGTVVTLTATPDSGWLFSNWGGDLTGSTNPTTITMNSNKTVTATFIEEGTTGTVGNETVFGSTSTSGYRRAMPFTMPENGTITSVTIYHAGGSGGLILGVYDGEGTPQARLGVTPSTTINSSAGWQTINLTSPAYVAGGATVWLAWVFQSNPGIRYTTGSPGRYQSSQTWSGGMPDPFGSGSQTSYIYSIYATYNK